MEDRGQTMLAMAFGINTTIQK